MGEHVALTLHLEVGKRGLGGVGIAHILMFG